MTVQEKRKKIEKLVIGTMNKMDKTHSNGNKYKDFFNNMSDEQFTKWANSFFKNDEENFYMEILPYKNEPLLEDLNEAADYLGIPLDEYIYFKHDGNKNNPIRSAYKVPVGYITLKRLQQMLMKKNSYSLDIDKRNSRTGQLTNDQKIARFTDAENFASAIWGMEAGVKELLGPRADDSVAKLQMYKQIASQGYTTLSSLENDVANKQTLNTIDVFMTGAGLMTDLITDNLELRRTQDNKQRRQSSNERINDKVGNNE